VKLWLNEIHPSTTHDDNDLQGWSIVTDRTNAPQAAYDALLNTHLHTRLVQE